MLAKYPGLSFEPEGGERAERSMLETLGLLVPVVLLAMYALMAALLRSYWKPLVAVAGFPMSFAGAVLAHWVLGWDLSAMSMLGLIAVFGVVVNDVLVLLDRYNTMRRENAALPAIAAAARGGPPPLPGRGPDECDHHPGAVSPALRTQRRPGLPGAVRREHDGRPDPVGQFPSC